ncbi:vWA domain-containing protein [Desulfonatronovibrio magnus]|uniref:vWA domain-containing protein n=1 Tax=Desulfonatronovibrio magnus TaxID=698827 RepID=UPI0005EB3E2E|nr:vWA domain-containing protein [Desulfonatronovibrio magnus]
MKLVTVLVDSSGSMKQKYQQSTYLEWALIKARNIIDSLDSADLSTVGIFSDKISRLSFSTKNDTLVCCDELIKQSLGSGKGTHLFDCAAEAACEIGRQKTEAIVKHLIVITDNKDRGSKKYKTWAELDNLLRKLSVLLQVVPVPGTEGFETGSNVCMGKNIRIEFDAEKITFQINETEHIEPLAISCPVLNFDDKVDDNVLKIISQQYQYVIPYLEKLTGLRYYPVPTVVVSESVIDKIAPFPSVIDSILDMFAQLCLLYHVHVTEKDSVHKEADFYPWMQAITEADLDSVHKETAFYRWVWAIAEADLASGINYYLMCGTCRGFSTLNHFEREIGRPIDTDDVKKAISIIEESWKNTFKKNSNKKIRSWQPNPYMFKSFSFTQNSLKELVSFLGAGKDVIMHEWELEEYRNGFGPYFITSSEQCFLLFSAIAKWLNTVIDDRHQELPDKIADNIQNTQKDPLYQYYRSIVRRYGFYLRRFACSDDLPKLVQTMIKNTGIVVLCANPIMEEKIIKFKKGGRIIEEKLNVDEVSKIFCSILLHEHFHAILQEGIPMRNKLPNVNEKPLEESLAQWAEINYFRSDTEMKNWCIAHALKGPFPYWPYAGAIFVEKIVESNPSEKFKELIDNYRNNPKDEYDVFLKKAKNLELS